MSSDDNNRALGDRLAPARANNVADELRELSCLIDEMVSHLDDSKLIEVAEAAGIREQAHNLSQLMRPPLQNVTGAGSPKRQRELQPTVSRASGTSNAEKMRASDRALQQLVEMIRTHKLAPGDQLPPERELASMLGVGRNSIREAIGQLSLLGLVAARQGGGTFVLKPDPATLVRPFRNVIEFGETSPQDIMEFRLIFEPVVAGLAALRLRRAAEDVLQELRKSIESFEDATRSGPENAIAFDTLFHHQIAQATGNPVILAVEQALMELLVTFRKESLSRNSYEPLHIVATGHRAIYDSLAKGDSHGAARAMWEHLSEAAKMIES